MNIQQPTIPSTLPTGRQARDNQKLPAFLKPLFWDCDFDTLAFNKHKKYITRRILNLGNLKAIKWLIKQVSLNFIKELVQTSRDINPKTRNYWQTIS